MYCGFAHSCPSSIWKLRARWRSSSLYSVTSLPRFFSSLCYSLNLSMLNTKWASLKDFGWKYGSHCLRRLSFTYGEAYSSDYKSTARLKTHGSELGCPHMRMTRVHNSDSCCCLFLYVRFVSSPLSTFSVYGICWRCSSQASSSLAELLLGPSII